MFGYILLTYARAHIDVMHLHVDSTSESDLQEDLLFVEEEADEPGNKEV